MGMSARRVSSVAVAAFAAASTCFAGADVQSMALYPPNHPLNTGAFEPFMSGAHVFVDHGNGVAVCEYFKDFPWAPQEERMVSVPSTVPSPGAIALSAAALVAFSAPRRRPSR